MTPAQSARSTTTGVAVDLAATAGCGGGSAGPVQTMDGRVSGCIQVGPLAPGPHAVVLDELLGFVPARPPFKLGRNTPPQLRELLVPPEPTVSLRAFPSAGPPGTSVTITGRLSAAPRPSPLGDDHPTFCWGGCRFGLRYQEVPIRWTSRRTFTARLIVPDAPWVEGNPARVIPLAAGSYPIELQCLVFGKLCAYERIEGTVDFHLRATKPPVWCSHGPSACAQLTVTPAAALPGQWVRVSGYAPLVAVGPSSQPLVFGLAVQRGRPHGPAVKLGEFKASPSALLGNAKLDVLAAPTFGSLNDTAPIAEVSAGLSPISAEPTASSTVAWCAPGGVYVSSRGRTSILPTATAGAALRRLHLVPNFPLACTALALAGPSSDPTAAVAAAFPAAPVKFGAPPFGLVALVTTDRGRSWRPIPTPPGGGEPGFGGFRYRRGRAEAVFAATVPGGPVGFPDVDPTKPLAEVSVSGGRAWRAAPLGCPSAGPCVTFGPYLSANCAMNPGTQPLLRSIDGGFRWSQPTLLDQVQACGEAELVASSGQDELLVDSTSQFPLQETTNGGASWHDVSLPLAPGEQGFLLGPSVDEKTFTLGPGPGGITVLPDGDLLLTGGQGYAGGWELLRRGSSTWCRVHSPRARTQSLPQLSSLTLIGNDLWWLTGDGRRAHHLDISAIGC